MEAPAPRLPQLPLLPLGLLGLGIAGAIVAQAQAREGLRLLGFWAYVSIVNGGPQDAGQVFEAYREAAGKDRVVGYWGYREETPALEAADVGSPEDAPAQPPYALRQR